MSKQETVERTVTIVLPMEVDKFLEKLAALNGMTVETMFRSEILDILSNFYECGHFEGWTEQATKRAKQMEKQVKELYC